jgi:hypothetical protein
MKLDLPLLSYSIAAGLITAITDALVVWTTAGATVWMRALLAIAVLALLSRLFIVLADPVIRRVAALAAALRVGAAEGNRWSRRL